MIQLYVSDPDVVKEFMTVKNQNLDKDGLIFALLRQLLGTSFTFNKINDDYLRKKKHTAMAFYRNHMYDMQENFKSVIK